MEGINTLLIWMVIFYILIGIAALIKNILYKKKLLASGIYEIDQMKGTTFEDYLETLLKTKGYQVKQTPKTGDYGADLILTKDQIKIAVQAKRYKNKVGIKALQEISSAKKYYNVDESWVITNNYFTQPAINLAKANNVHLFDRDQLVRLILDKKKD